MKKNTMSFLLFAMIAIIVSGCQKNKDNTTTTTPKSATPVPSTAPIADFKITSLLSSGPSDVQEGKIMEFENNSVNSDFYLWDFGNGTYSTDRVPTNIVLWPCSTTLNIKLTVESHDGRTATYSAPYNVICYRTVPGANYPTNMPKGWSSH